MGREDEYVETRVAVREGTVACPHDPDVRILGVADSTASREYPMINRLPRTVVAGLALTGMLALAACGPLGKDDPSPTPAASDTAQATPAGAAPSESAASDGTLPDVCKLLSATDVNTLTGREVRQTDKDAGPSESTRYCQWQLSEGVLAVFLSPTSESDFSVRSESGQDYSGVGDEAYTDSGHLYVRSDKLQIDVYATGAESDDQNLTIAKATATKVIGLI
jgi:hypothetical protein